MAEMNWKIWSLLGFKLMKLYGIRDSPLLRHLMLTFIRVSQSIVKRNSVNCQMQKCIVSVFLQTYIALVTHSRLTLWNSMDCSPPGSSVRGILQAKILWCVAIPFYRGSFWPRDRTQVSHIAGRFFTDWVTREAHFCKHNVTSNRKGYMIGR